MKSFASWRLGEITLVFLLCIGIQSSNAQEKFTRKDSLRGSLRFERTCFDVLRYDLDIKVNPQEKSIQGFNDITFNVIEDTPKIQLDLFENMVIDSIVLNGKKLQYQREFYAVFVKFQQPLLKD